jgi:Spy/CpxP family protein refolding chaperone
MNWKYLRIAALATCLATPAAASAQNPDSARADHHAYGQFRGRAMSGPAGWLLAHRDELKLTDDQVKKLESQQDKFRKDNEKLMDQMRKNRENARNDAEGVLTPQQRDQVKQRMAEMRQEMRQRHDSLGPGRRPGPRGDSSNDS